jgi:hypothetical protein
MIDNQKFVKKIIKLVFTYYNGPMKIHLRRLRGRLWSREKGHVRPRFLWALEGTFRSFQLFARCRILGVADFRFLRFA